MTLAKSSVVSRSALAESASKLGLEQMITAGPGLGSPDSWPDSVTGNAFEALAGAVYLDGGLQAARDFVLSVLSKSILKLMHEGAPKDYKSLLLEMTQADSGEQPVYKVIREEGSPHDRTFVVSAMAGSLCGEGVGRTKKEAEQRAAESLLQKVSHS
jgi:ribonuclease-3